MARRAGGSRNRGGSGSSSSCDINDAYTEAVIALNVIWMLIFLAIAAFAFLFRKKRMVEEAKPNSPIKWWNWLLAILLAAFACLLDFSITAAAACGSLDDDSSTVAGRWFGGIAFILLVWAILISTIGTFWTLSGGSFKIIKYVYLAIFALLAILILANLALLTRIVTWDAGLDDDYLDSVRSQNRLVTAIAFIWFFTTISVAVLLVLALLGMKRSGMPVGNLNIWLPAFIVSLVAWAFVDVIVFPTYYLDGSDILTVGKAIAILFFRLLFQSMVFFFLLMMGTSPVLAAAPAESNTIFTRSTKSEGAPVQSAPQPTYQHTQPAPQQVYQQPERT